MYIFVNCVQKHKTALYSGDIAPSTNSVNFPAVDVYVPNWNENDLDNDSVGIKLYFFFHICACYFKVVIIFPMYTNLNFVHYFHGFHGFLC